MSGKYTPGPWTAAVSMTDSGADFWSVYGSDNAAVVYATLRGRGQLAANARLIAAAPELLEALVAFQQHVIRNACVWADAESGSHHHPIWQQVAAAIAKAKGESSKELSDSQGER